MFELLEQKKASTSKIHSFSVLITLCIYLCNAFYHTHSMSASLNSTMKGGISKSKEQSSKKKKKNSNKQIILTNRSITPSSSSLSDYSTPHQQHHSAPPAHHQTSKAGLHAINENGEYLSNTEQPQDSTTTTAVRFPRSSTVPHSGNSPASYPCYYSDNGTLVPGTVSPAQLNAFYHSRQPLSIINTNFQPISPHHYPYNSRPVDILKPTFLIVPKEAEQKLSAQLSASNSPSPTKSMTKKSTTVDTVSRHVGVMATPNPSPYVHFVNKTHPIETSQEGLPETSIIQENFTTSNEFNQTSASISSMPNIALTQGKTSLKSEDTCCRSLPIDYCISAH